MKGSYFSEGVNKVTAAILSCWHVIYSSLFNK